MPVDDLVQNHKEDTSEDTSGREPIEVPFGEGGTREIDRERSEKRPSAEDIKKAITRSPGRQNREVSVPSGSEHALIKPTTKAMIQGLVMSLSHQPIRNHRKQSLRNNFAPRVVRCGKSDAKQD